MPEFEPDQQPIPTAREPRAMAEQMRQLTPARVFVHRCGPALLTTTQLELRSDHAAALDAVHTQFDLHRDLGTEFVDRWKIFEVSTRAQDRPQYLMRPDLGRVISDAGRQEILLRCPCGPELQIAIGDGLSSAAVMANVPQLLPRLHALSNERGLLWGQPFAIRFCRVGVLNDMGELLDPAVVVLLIGERPGLATATSLSAYMAYRPRSGDTDAKRNLVSNIHQRGVPIEQAANRIITLAQKMITMQKSGVEIKE
jgi:ethanolamine ammonia-lyase small subunit